MANAPFHLLLVEDNPADVGLIRIALDETGVSVRLAIAYDGEQALAALFGDERRFPDLILLDLNLPKRDGFEVLQAIKEDSRLRTIPVIILSSSQSPEEIERAYASRANSYLIKPSNLDAVFQLVRRLERFWLATATLPPTAA